MAYIGDFALGSTFDTKFTTIDSTGLPVTLAGTPVISAYPDNSTTELTAGITLTVGFDSRTGMHNIRVVATGANGYATATNYQLVITTGTVDGISVVGYVVAEFSIEARSAIRPTTAGRTLDVTAAGEAGIDWANIGSPTTAQNLSATNIDVDQVVASVSGAVGSVAAGGITATSIATNAIDADALAADAVAEIADGVWDEDATGHQTLGTFGQAIGDPVADSNTIYGAVVTGAAGATIAADIIAIEAQTDDIGIAGAGLTGIPWNAAWDAEVESEVDDALGAGTGTSLTAIPWNAAWDAEVQSEVDDALVAQRLDELVNADSDIDGLAPPTVGSVFHELLTKTAGSFTYDQTTDSLEAVRDRGDATWITATGFALATVCTEARLAELDAANLPATTDSILTDTGTTLDGRIPAALVAGRMDASVGAVAAGAITAAGIAADAIGASELAADAANEIADAILDRDMSTGTDSGSTTVRTPRQALRALRNRVAIAAGTLTAYKEDDATASWTGAVTTAAGNPISEVDPAGP